MADTLPFSPTTNFSHICSVNVKVSLKWPHHIYRGGHLHSPHTDTAFLTKQGKHSVKQMHWAGFHNLLLWLTGDLIELFNHLFSTSNNSIHIRNWTDWDPILSEVKQFILQRFSNMHVEDKFKPYQTRWQELSVVNRCVIWGSRVFVLHTRLRTCIEEIAWHPTLAPL